MHREETGRFEAEAEDGERCTIIEYTNMISVSITSGPRRGPGRGARSYMTSDGRPINYLSDQHFRDVHSEKVFKRIESHLDAPSDQDDWQ